MKKSLAQNAIFNIIYKVLNLVFPLVSTMYVSRVLMPSGVGSVSFAQNAVSYFIMFASLGLPTYGVREIAKIRSDKNKTNKLFTELLIINWITTLFSTIAFIIMVFSVKGFVEDKALFLCCGIQLFFNFINIDWFYQGQEDYVYIACRSIVIKVISIIAIFIFVKSKEDYVIYALISSIATAGNYIFNIVNVRKYVKIDISKLELKRHIQPIFILAVSIFFASIYSKIDITMLGSMSTKEATGFYTNANHLVAINIAICASITSVFLPRLSYYYKNERKKFFELIDLGIKVLSFFSIPIMVGLFLLAPTIVSIIYGDAYAEAVPTIRILSVLIIVKGFGDLLCYQLAIATSTEKKRIPSYAIAAVINVVLNALLIPWIGHVGAAIASVISEVFLNVHQFFKLRKIVNYSIDKKVLLQSLFATAMMALSIVLIGLIELNEVINCILAVCVGSIVYLLINYLVKNKFMQSIISKLKK